MKYYSMNDYCREKYGKKLYKLSLDGGFTCPNRDGTKGTGGCIFCSAAGSGDFAEAMLVAYNRKCKYTLKWSKLHSGHKDYDDDLCAEEEDSSEEEDGLE